MYIPNAEQCEELKRKADKTLKWGSVGKNLDESLRFRSLQDLDTDHLENIIISCPDVSPQYKASILMLLKERYQTPTFTVADLTQTCFACPTSWAGVTTCGKSISACYRHGWLTVCVEGDTILSKAIPKDADGVLSLDELKEHAPIVKW